MDFSFSNIAPFLVLLGIIAVALSIARYRKPPKKYQLPANYRDTLEKYVAFYRALDEDGKSRFDQKIRDFLAYVRIHGVNVKISDTDRLLVASSAIIPIFGFPEWRYYNLSDVLLYEDAFDANNFSAKEGDRNILGMVGEGAMQRMMILSKPALYLGFENSTDKGNVGIHEFVHLLDKEDGAVDGVPEALLDKQYTLPWLKHIQENIGRILKGDSDINVYGATNSSEFFAVAAEYFFERPDLFRSKHPDLYKMMTLVFRQEPETSGNKVK